MGRLRTTPGFHERMRNQHRAFFSSIHRATVIDTSSAVTKGTVDARIEGSDVTLSDMLAPLMSFSIPPKGKLPTGEINTVDDNGASAAWGRYIPQVGDVLLVGFDTNGEPYALGYHATFFGAMDIKDKQASARGGIGWGVESDVKLKPGDWDFISKRNGRLMLTDKVHLSSGPHTFTLDQSAGAATLTSTLAVTQYGEASKELQGSVRRFILPTDTTETEIYGIFGSVAQESTNIVKRGSLVVPGGFEMARTSIGEVIDETTFLPMVPAVTYPALNKLVGTGTRIFRSVKDPVGKTDFFTEIVDDLGNYGLSATTATALQWATPLSTWTVLNASTDWTSSTGFSVTTLGALDLTATAGATITAAQVALGGSGAADYLIKGTQFKVALDLFLMALGALVSGTPVQNAAAIAAIVLAANAMKLSIASSLSTVTKTV